MGYRREVYNRQGQLLRVDDTRTLPEEKARKRKRLIQQCRETSLVHTDEFREAHFISNMLTAPELTRIRTHIQNCKQTLDTLLSQVNSAMSLAQLDAIGWPMASFVAEVNALKTILNRRWW